MNFVQNILWNSIEGFVEAGTRSVGEYAGDALIKAGDLIENSGRGVGESIERTASAYGQKIAGQGYQPGPKALPAPSKKIAVKRSSSMPAVSTATRKAPVASKKALPSAKTATNQIRRGLSVSDAKTTARGEAQKTAVTARKTATRGTVTKTSTLPKPYPNNVPHGASITPSSTKKSSADASKSKNLPKPYPRSNTPFYPTEKKTPVTPSRPKPFIVENRTLGGAAGGEKNKDGTNRYTRQAGKTSLRPLTYGPTAEKGKMEHIPLSAVGSKMGEREGGRRGGQVGGGGGEVQHIPVV
ncbi:uncharacterized protein EI97DRAFT_459752 [Westerdykella ornata]|uniref:Uncharacterized protein n=1 Tax=Westerdykella ornata TaxID=318751 RepID=A0A6A6JFK9_WESOR|nr:uncharacterized protein EI97DRAFT_459752 [Westerdykella ornata]KAF2274778.1 hypothetical protein EI97DRAFT_459752 [Westerdykella ornata]